MSRDRWLQLAERVGLSIIALFVASMVALLALAGGVVLFALALLTGGAVALGWAIGTGRPDPGARRLTFDEHAATAAAILQPDHPMFDAGQAAHIAGLTSTPFADAVEHDLAAHTHTTPEEN